MENLKKQLLDTNWYVLVMNYCREESLLFMGFHINFSAYFGQNWHKISMGKRKSSCVQINRPHNFLCGNNIKIV